MRLLNQRHPARSRIEISLVGGMAVVLGVCVFASSVMASSHNPTGEFKEFGECPLNTPAVEECVFSVTTGGSVKIGKKSVPIVNPVTLQGGLAPGESGEALFVAAENGQTLSKTAQPVPGGLTGITAPTWWPKSVQDWFNNLISEGFTGVDATVELAAPASKIKISNENLINQEGTVLGLPVKIKLDNAILGNNCYIGSNLKPVQINLVTGTSGTLKGSPGEINFNETFNMVTITGARLVDGLFTAPGASGCGGIFSLFVDPLVNEVLGTPSGSGKNEAILESDIKDATANAVRNSE